MNLMIIFCENHVFFNLYVETRSKKMLFQADTSRFVLWHNFLRQREPVHHKIAEENHVILLRTLLVLMIYLEVNP
jgi:hypothetical protein